MLPRLRIFLSSPGDVEQERLRAHLVIQKLAREYARFFSIEPFLWEYEPMLASGHFQDAIDPPSSFDVVLLILWSRLGTPLPERTAGRAYRGIDERAPVTGTEWEFEDALKANRAHGGKGPPDLLAYRRDEVPTAPLDDPKKRDEKIAQYAALEGFWARWFKSDTQFLAGYAQYRTLDEFDRKLESDLSKLIQRRIRERHVDQAAPIWLTGSPFRGLEAYDFSDAPIFFGRDGDTRDGLTRLAEAAARGTAFLLVAGASGSGKSSLARAGLLPALVATKAVADVGLWRRAIMRPGDAGADPILALARALVSGDPAKGEGLLELAGPHTSAEELAAHFRSGDPAFLFKKTLREIADAERSSRGLLPHEQARLVLLVDQLEELFTRAEISADDRVRFAGLLAALARSGAVWVIATMRSDHAYRVDELKELHEIAEQGARLALAAPDSAQLLEMIRQPAQAAGLKFESDPATGLPLDALLVKEAGAAPGILPHLSVLLDDLYRRDVLEARTGGVLTLATYRALVPADGGLRTAIGQRAERVLQGLQQSDPEAVKALPRLLRALVTTAGAAEAPAARPAPLASFAPDGAELRLVEALLRPDARLLTAEDRGRGPQVRLAHEALIESWPRAKAIVAESVNFIRVRDEVETQRRKWEAAKRRREFLLARGLPLAEAEEIVRTFGEEISPEAKAFVQASRARAKLVQMLGWGVAVLLAIVAGTAVWQGIESDRNARIAQAERARAEQNFAAAKQTVDGLIFNIAQGLQDVQGMRAESVRKILETVEQTIARLAETAPDDPELQRSRGVMFLNFGDVYLRTGDIQRAVKSYEASLAIRRKLAATYPASGGFALEVSTSLERIGDAKVAAGDQAGALLAFTESLEIRRRLLAAHPDDRDLQRSLAVILDRVADVKAAQGDTASALDVYAQALEIRRKLASADPGNTEAQRDLAISFNNIGAVRLSLGDAVGALAAYEQGLAVARKLAAFDPGNTEWQRDLSVSLEHVGDAKSLAGDRSGALPAYEESLAIRRRLVASDPVNTTWQGDLAVSFLKIGDIKFALRDAAGALASYQESLAIRRKLAAADPADALAQRRVSIGLNRVAGTKWVLGDDAGALQAFMESADIMRRLAATQPDNTQWQLDLVVALRGGARVETDAAHKKALLEEALRIVIALDAKGVLTPDQKTLRAAIEAELAKLGGTSQ